MQYLGMDPGDINGLDYLAVLTNTDKLVATSTYDFNSFMEDIAAVDPVVWRSRGVDVGAVVDKYATRILADQTRMVALTATMVSISHKVMRIPRGGMMHATRRRP